MFHFLNALPEPPRGKANAHTNLALLIGSLVVAVAVGEVLCRIFIPSIGWRPYNDVGLGWASGEYQAYDPKADTGAPRPRILFLGDSYLAGGGVSRSQTRFPILLLDHFPHGSVRIFATGGWGTDQELLAFVQKGQSWQPDIVVLTWCATNDLANNLSNRHVNGKLKPYFRVEADGTLALYDGEGRALGAPPPPSDQRPRIQSYLADLIRGTLAARKQAQNTAPPSGSAVDPRYLLFDNLWQLEEEVQELRDSLSWAPQSGVNRVSAFIAEDFELNAYGWRLTGEILTALRTAVEDAGGQFIVMLLPVSFYARDPDFVAGADFRRPFATSAGTFTYDSSEPRHRLRDICAAAGIDFFDPTPEFIRIIEEQSLYTDAWPNPKDRHFSDVGHAILSDLLARHLTQDYGDVVTVPRK